MSVRPLFGSLCASLDDFLTQPMHIVGASGASAVAILDANQPVFYVFSPDAWLKMSESGVINVKKPKDGLNNSTQVMADSRRLQCLAFSAQCARLGNDF